MRNHSASPCIINRKIDTRTCISTYKKIQKLNWRTRPSTLLPHGLTGLISILIGTYLVFGKTIRGVLDPFTFIIQNSDSSGRIPILVLLYVTTTVASAIAGYRLSNVAATIDSRVIFKRCAILQCMLCYFTVRFLPHTTIVIDAVIDALREDDNDNDNDNEIIVVFKIFIRILDVLATLVLVSCILSFNGIVFAGEDEDQKDHHPKSYSKSKPKSKSKSKQSSSISLAIAFGSVCLLLLAAYPLQLAYNGQEHWWKCIQGRYTMQAPGMVAFIYVPTTLAFNIILFGVTLYQRKILSEFAFGCGSIIIIFTCIVSTVLLQEVHIPNVSTQRIYLPCVEPEPGKGEGVGSFDALLVESMDFSKYARKILAFIFNVHFEDSDANELWESVWRNHLFFTLKNVISTVNYYKNWSINSMPHFHLSLIIKRKFPEYSYANESNHTKYHMKYEFWYWCVHL